MKKFCFLAIVLLASINLLAQDNLTVYPTNWWTGMKHKNLTLLVKSAEAIGSPKLAASVNKKGISVKEVRSMENNHYVKINIAIDANATPGLYTIRFGGIAGNTWKSFQFELKKKSMEDGKSRVRGVTSEDFTYLLMPDRFANGDPSNDAFDDMRDKTSDRANKFARHGGDLKGVQDHLEYFKDLGITTLWFTPVFDNDMPKMKENNTDMAGYHGYWFTDHYKVDKRFGGNEGYKTLVNAAHQKGLKIIQDAIYNHVGLYHWIYQDAPAKDWINEWPSFTGPNHREETMFDPYGSKFDKNNMVKGWFVPHLPDLNLANTDLSTFLVQHAIWSVEEFGIDGYRIDTYKYCDEKFVNRVNEELKAEFPQLTTFVEAWVNTVVGNAYFVQNNFNIPFKHNAPGAIDFSLCFAMQTGMNQPAGWTEGVNRVYMTLSQDLVYNNPLNNCIFLDNHDMDRVYSVIGEDWNKMKWGLNWLLTMRGIPQIFYGTELLMKNFKNPTDAEVRYDFPGGWKEDAVNKFTAAGRNEKENAAYNYISKLAHFRQRSSALKTGKTIQFIVRDGVYVYFRYDAKETVMVITNTGSKEFTPDWTMYAEVAAGFTKAWNVQTETTTALTDLKIQPGDSQVLKLIK